VFAYTTLDELSAVAYTTLDELRAVFSK